LSLVNGGDITAPRRRQKLQLQRTAGSGGV
jgi:hypothetical protein